jgi:hypothetical protein
MAPFGLNTLPGYRSRQPTRPPPGMPSSHACPMGAAERDYAGGSGRGDKFFLRGELGAIRRHARDRPLVNLSSAGHVLYSRNRVAFSGVYVTAISIASSTSMPRRDS